MPLEIKIAKLVIHDSMLGLTRDEHTCDLLRDELKSKISSTGGYRKSSKFPLPIDLKPFIDDFCEHPASGALENVKTYFRKTIPSGYTIGGRRAYSKPKVYPKKKIKPSSADISALGEGIVGYYFEKIKTYTFEIRPFNVSPDLIFRDNSVKPSATHLVEVKTSLSDKNPNLTTAIEQLSLLAKTSFLRSGKYVSHVCQVYIRKMDFLIIKDLTRAFL